MRYNPQKIEKKWQKVWREEKIYEPDLKSAKKPFGSAQGKPFYNLMMFPYPSAEGLHVGNMYAFTGSDIYGRFKRMQGNDVFQPIGLDGFGIHSENYAIKVGAHPTKQAKVSEKNFYKQLEMIGNGFAWDEKLETYDPLYYKWTQWIFIQLFKNGLAYRKKAAVNWCPSCKTVLADEQVIQKSQISNLKSQINSSQSVPIGVCERCSTVVVIKELEQWFFRITNYAERLLKNLETLDWSEKVKIAQKNWIGKSEGALIEFPISNSQITKTNFVFLHAFKDTSKDAFWPWLKKEIDRRGGKVFAPNLPNSAEPIIDEQVDFVLKNHKFNEKTVIITHSLGGVVAMKLLPKLNVKISKLIMISPPLRMKFLDGKRRLALEKSCNWKFNFGSIKKKTSQITVVLDKKDHIVPSDQPKEIAKKLQANLIETIAQKSHFNGPIEPEVLNILAPEIEVFTTRPDTLFGATYMVLAPEHQLISNLKSQISNFKEVAAYVKKAKLKSEEDRIAEGKIKTGVELKGVRAINPTNGKEIPVWVADYVLASYGTGAIMAVPAHDERDFEFAKKYKLQIQPVIMPIFGEPVEKEEFRHAVSAFVRRPSDGKYLFVKVKGFDRITKVYGGIEKNESPGDAAMREVFEETGYKTKFVRDFGWPIQSHFYHPIKKVNRCLVGEVVELEIIDETQYERDPEEADRHEVVWLNLKEARREIKESKELYDFKLLERTACHVSDGILINSGKFSGMDSEKAKWEITKFVGGERKTQYRLRDWLISRQRYWGPPIPLVFCENCAENLKSQISNLKNKEDYNLGELENPGWVAIPEKDLPVKLPYVEDFRPKGKGESPLASVKSFYETKCPKCGSKARRETDVSDTFLDSSWYYIGYLAKSQISNLKSQILPFSNPLNKKWLPVDMYIGGAEHSVLHLLYVRFLAMAFKDWNLVEFEEPFKKFRAHGLLIKEGAKMSKSKGNVVNPDEYIKKFGADALRMYLMFLAPFLYGGDFRDGGILGITRFLERVYKLISNFQFPISKKIQNSKPKISNELERVLHKTIKKVTEDIENLRYNTAISALMILLNEMEKNNQRLTTNDLQLFLKLLAPFAPHISEELWQQFFANSKSNPPAGGQNPKQNSTTKLKNTKQQFRSIHLEKWSEYDLKLIEEEIFELVIQINGKHRGTMSAQKGIVEEEARKLAFQLERVSGVIGSQKIKKIIFVPDRLINFVI